MAFIEAPTNAVRTVLDGVLRGQQVINVLHYLFDAEPEMDELELLNETIHNTITPDTTGLFEAIGPEYTLQRITSTRVNLPGGIQHSLSSGQSGKANTEALGNMQALVVTLRTAQAGRSFRGRTYLAGISEGNLMADPNYVDTSGNFIRDTFEEGFVANPLLMVTPASLCVASYYTTDGLVPPSSVPRALAVYTPVTQIEVNSRLDTQRRRRPPG